MSDQTKIEWTDSTWNPVTGCTKVSPGCDHCYAEVITERFHGKGSFAEVKLHPDRLDQPLRWRKPRKVFVNSMSDLFHDQVPDEYIAKVFAAMAMSPRHTFQVLTKRHARMRSLLSGPSFPELVTVWAWRLFPGAAVDLATRTLVLPLSNVWLGVSAENQQWANIRIPALLDTPAAVRFVSAEPLLGPIDFHGPLVDGWHRPRLTYWLTGRPCFGPDGSPLTGPRLDWVIVGGESGRGARPMHPAWASTIRDQCRQTDTPFLFKQWGEWVTEDQSPRDITLPATGYSHLGADEPTVWKVGKKRAGRELDGRTWDEFPTPHSAAQNQVIA